MQIELSRLHVKGRDMATAALARSQWKSSWRVRPTKLVHYQIPQIQIELSRLHVKGCDMVIATLAKYQWKISRMVLLTKLFRYQIPQMQMSFVGSSQKARHEKSDTYQSAAAESRIIANSDEMQQDTRGCEICYINNGV